MLMHDIPKFHALRTPEREALVCETGQRETWAQLERSVERAADLLAAAGVRKGDVVSCLSRNRAEMIHIYLGANRLGAVFAPVNYRFAPPEILQVLIDSRPRVFIGHEQFTETIDSLKNSKDLDFIAHWLMIADSGACSYRAALDAAPRRDYFPDILDEDVSWICYTGGTTGRSKGVELTHRSMTASAINFIVVGSIKEDDVYFVAGALFHIALVVPFAYWMVGGKAVIANFEAKRSLDLLLKEGTTQIICTGTIFKMMTEDMEANPRPTKLRIMYCGGAPVSPELMKRAEAAFGCGIGNIYGQTEVTLMATLLTPQDYHRALAAPAGSVEAKRVNSVGIAVPLCTVAVFDNDMNLMPAGEVGEISVKGPITMKRYANMPDVTRDTMRDGWVRSGDLGYMDEGGFVYLVDRKKDMIVSGGENVYTSEVELVLCRHPGVSEAAVIGIPDSHWGEAVLALVVSKDGAKLDSEEIRTFCRSHLAGYKIPKRVEFHESFPRLPTGKIAKGALRDIYWKDQEKRIHGI